MSNSPTILKNAQIPPQEDYHALRSEGIRLIEELGSKLWTDYNIHDPGITLLELLCYAITDIGYREGFSIEDLLTPASGDTPADSQCFFTARRVLTMQPLTPNDYRKLLIDLNGIRNAWHSCSPCGCGITLYANCAKSILQYDKTEHPIPLRGFNDVLIELESQSTAGDLNSGKIFQTFRLPATSKTGRAIAECRFAPWHVAAASMSLYEALINPASTLAAAGVTVTSISGNTNQAVDIPADNLYKALRQPLFASFDLTIKPDPDDAATITISLKNIPVKIWYRSDEDRQSITVAHLRSMLSDSSPSGVVSQYVTQLKQAAVTIKLATQALHAHRNLAEDFCRVSTVPICDVALCADIEMTPDADIEAVLGEAYWQIEQYLNPVIPFHPLRQLLDRNIPVEEIFNGPALAHGFILNEDLDKGNLRKYLYSSDLINILMDIPGIKAVRNIALARYDAQAKLVESQPWTLKIPEDHQPRLYVHASKVLVFKNGLPFLPNPDELNDTLQLWKARNQQNKLVQHDNDLAIPKGVHVNDNEVWPLQNMLPDTYGTGINGLPDGASVARRGQAKQLKAYLLLLEHLLQSYILKLAHLKDQFSIDPSVSRTWYAQIFTEGQLKGANDLYSNQLTGPAINDMLEHYSQYIQHRNQMLDHLLGRFAEQFNDYALQLFTLHGNPIKAGESLIASKINFLKLWPEVSATRAQAFDYRNEALVCNPANHAGFTYRIRLLLGLNGIADYLKLDIVWLPGTKWQGSWQFTDNNGGSLLQGETIANIDSEAELRNLLHRNWEVAADLLKNSGNLTAAGSDTAFTVVLKDEDETIVGSSAIFGTLQLATDHKDKITDWLQQIEQAQKIFVVEHLLLRPRYKPMPAIPDGDPLLGICIPGDCNLCGDEDPYSFRITIVLNGEQELGLANQGIAFRRYAEQAIRREAPAHLGVKICWVSAEQLAVFETKYCAWLTELAKETQDEVKLHETFTALLELFEKLKSVYPPATLHDCVDGDDENRVYLNQTVV